MKQLSVKVLVKSNKIEFKYDSFRYGIELNENNNYTNSFNGLVLQEINAIDESINVQKEDGTIVVCKISQLFDFNYFDDQSKVSMITDNTVINLDGEQTEFFIPHGLGIKPKSFAVTFRDAANLNFVQSHRDVDETNIIITCNDAPAIGVQKVFWQVYR